MLTTLEVEQLRLHFKETVVFLDEEGGDLYRINYIENEEGGPPYWDGYILNNKDMWSPHSIKYGQREIIPYYPDSGYYNVGGDVIFYSRTGYKQWRESYPVGGDGLDVFRLESAVNLSTDSLPCFNQVNLIKSLFYPEDVGFSEALNILENNKLGAIAINRKIALLKVYPNRKPIVMYRETPVGYVTSNDEVALAPPLAEFYEELIDHLPMEKL